MNQEMDLGSDWVTIASPVQANVVLIPGAQKTVEGAGARLNFELQKLVLPCHILVVTILSRFDLKDFKINILKDHRYIWGSHWYILDSTQILINYQQCI